MSLSIASLGMKLDSTGVEQGINKLDNLVTAAERADKAEVSLEQQSRETSKAVSELGDAAAQAAQTMSAADATATALAETEAQTSARVREVTQATLLKRQATMEAAIATSNEATAQRGATAVMRSAEEAQQRFLAALREQTALHGKSQADILRYRAAQLGVTRDAEAYIQRIEQSAVAMGRFGLTAGQATQAMRLLPAQITDIVTGLSSGQRPFMVAIQQGGQLRDSFGGIGNAARAMASLLTPARLAVGGVGAVAVLTAKAIYDAEQESFALAKSLTLSGNAAGVTRTQLVHMAQDLAEASGTQREAAQTLAALASTGRVAGRNLEEFATVARDLKRTAGQPIEDTVKALADLGRDPVQASQRLNEQYNYLTASVYRQIRAAQEQGRTFDAAEIAQREFARAMEDRSKTLETQLGTLQKLARGTGDVFRWLGEQILSIGRAPALDDQLAGLKDRIRQLEDLQRRFPEDKVGGLFTERAVRLAALKEQSAALQREKDAEDAAAVAGAKRRKELERSMESERRATQVTQARSAAVEAAAKQNLDINLTRIQRSLDASLAGYSAYQSSLEALHRAGLVSDEHYANARRELIERQTREQLGAIAKERAAIQAEIDRLSQPVGGVSIGAGGSRRVRRSTTADDVRQQAQQQQQIASLKEKIADLDAQSAATQTKSANAQGDLNLELQQTAALADRILTSARATAEATLATINQQRQRELASFGLGDRQREFNAGLNDIEDRYAEERRRLEDQKSRGDFKDREDLYQQLLANADDFRARDLAGYEQYWSDLSDLQSDWSVGAREALSNYLDASRDVAGQSKELFTNAFRGMEDALVEFASTGKANFKQLAQSIIADLLRIQIRAALANIAGKASESASSGSGWGQILTTALGAIFGKRAEGGPVESGRPYLVGERGPELIVPARSGTVIPNHKLGGQSVVVNSTLNVAPGMDVAQFSAVLNDRDARLKSEIAENIKRGRWDGILA